MFLTCHLQYTHFYFQSTYSRIVESKFSSTFLLNIAKIYLHNFYESIILSYCVGISSVFHEKGACKEGFLPLISLFIIDWSISFIPARHRNYHYQSRSGYGQHDVFTVLWYLIPFYRQLAASERCKSAAEVAICSRGFGIIALTYLYSDKKMCCLQKRIRDLKKRAALCFKPYLFYFERGAFSFSFHISISRNNAKIQTTYNRNMSTHIAVLDQKTAFVSLWPGYFFFQDCTEVGYHHHAQLGSFGRF